MTDAHQEGSDAALFEAIVVWLESGDETPLRRLTGALDVAALAPRIELVRSMLARLGEARLAPLERAAEARALALVPTNGVAALASEALSALRAAWRTLYARLVEDVGPVAALRAARPHGAFQLYTVEGYDVDLWVSERGALVGQVLALEGCASFDSGRCTLVPLEGRGAVRSVGIEPEGEFVIEGPIPALFELVLEAPPAEDPAAPRTRIVLERVALGRGRA